MTQPTPIKAPQAILFACTLNAVRSPMAEGLARQLLGKSCYVASAGLRKNDVDPFAVAIMRESGIDIGEHVAQGIDDVDCGAFDVIVALSPEMRDYALEATRTMATQVEYWPVPDLSGEGETRTQKLDAFRAVRDGLRQRIRERFGG
jgi:protein-tyrosine-phosphatase